MTTQERIYAFIRDYIMAYNHSPSFQEILAGVGLKSKASIEYHLFALDKKGLLLFTPGIGRGIRLRDTEMARILESNPTQLRVQVIRNGVLFEGIIDKRVSDKESLPGDVFSPHIVTKP